MTQLYRAFLATLAKFSPIIRDISDNEVYVDRLFRDPYRRKRFLAINQYRSSCRSGGSMQKFSRAESVSGAEKSNRADSSAACVRACTRECLRVCVRIYVWHGIATLPVQHLGEAGTLKGSSHRVTVTWTQVITLISPCAVPTRDIQSDLYS